MAVLSIGQMWGADPSVKSTFSTSSTVTDNKVTENGVTWTLDVTVAAGTPTITTGTASSTQGLKFGSSGSNYYSPIKFSTDYFKDYNVKSVTIYEKNNGSKIGTLTVKQGSITIGTASHSAKTSDWATLTASGTKGEGGTLEVTYEVAQASYFNYIEVVYEEGGTTCSSEITITKADNPANGTFTIDNSGAVCIDEGNATVNVTATPADHYHLASVTTTGSVGTIGSIAGNTCEITDIDEDTEIGVTFEEDTKYQVTWNVNGNEDTKTNVYAGEKPVFPATPAACDATSTTFIGWATAPWTGKLADLSEKTVYTSASAMPDVDAAVTYYAVFAKSSGSASELFSWAGGTKAELTAAEGVAALNADNSDYADSHAPYRVKWNGDGKYIIISVASQPGKVSAGFKMIGGGTTSTITVQEADDAEGPFTDVENLAISGATNDIVNLETTQAFKSTTRAIKLYYTKGSNVGLGPISIEGVVSYSDYMTTCAAPTCEDLGTPVVTVTNKTYNSAKLTWAAVANAAKYMVKFNGVDQDATENLYFDAADLDPETQYTYQVKALAAANQDDYCDSEFSTEANFTTEAAPTAKLTLMENGSEVDGGNHAVSVPFALPTAVTHTCGKTFVGWDANPTCATAPTYAPGASFTFADQTGVTLYAVYANVGAGTTTNIHYTGSSTGNMTGENDAADLVDATDVTGWSVVGYKGAGSNFPGLNKDGTIRLYYSAGGNSYIEVTAPQTIASVALTMGELNNVIVKVGDNTVAISDGVYPIGAKTFTIINGNTTNIQAHIQNIAVNFPGAQSNWATTCVDPLENPTFSLDPVVAPVNDKYEEAINVVITNNAGEGTIYYTTNGQNPTSASTQYAGAITLNTCGTKTIKAIVISATNQSEVVTATYEMAIPIPSVSAEDPYTEAEAVAVIDGGCYNNEDVWVTGTVASNGAAWYQNTGTYTITLENGFKFYYFYEGANEQAFTTNYIAAGDVLVAKGKLEKSGNTYRLAQGCYLVSRTEAPKTPIDSDIDNPITVAAALNYIDQAATYDLTNVYVKGVASADPDNQGTFNIHDANVDNTFQIYKGVLSDALIAAGEEVEENDTIIAFGELKKYYSTYEMAEGGEIVVVKKYIAPLVNVESVELTESSASVEAGETVTLHAAVNPNNATDQVIVWSVTSGSTYASVDQNGVVTGIAAGEATVRATANADATKFAECTVTVTPSSIPENTDIITAAKIGLTGNSYDNWSGKNNFGTTSVYAGNSMNATGTNAGAIQLRSKENSGIVLTNSNGLMLKGLSVTVKSGSNTLNVYAKATAYSSTEDLYSDDEAVRGTLIGTVSATGEMTLEDGILYDDNYQYIGMRSAANALYLTDITITWGEAVTPTPTYNVTISDQIENGSVVSNKATAEENEEVTLTITADAGYELSTLTINGGANVADAVVNGEYTFNMPAADVTVNATFSLIPTPPTPDYGSYQRNVTNGNYGTICLPKAGTIEGAMLYNIGSFENGMIYVDEAGTTLEAGKPYIFQATANQLNVTYTSATVEETAGDANGLYGFYDLDNENAQFDIPGNAGNYILYSNQYWLVDNVRAAYINNFRAYIKIGQIQNAQPAPGIRRVAMQVNGQNTTTGVDNLNAGETPVKVMINGQMYILRGEKMYNANGQLVK